LKVIIHLKETGPKALRRLKPDIKGMMASHDGTKFKGISVCTAGGAGEVDFHSRYFAPWNGIDEDPVNGSSHTVLAPYWWGKRKAQMLVARMESSRGGKLLLRCSDNKVHIGGNAVVVTSGNFFLPKLPSNGSIKPHPASSYHTPHPRVSRILGHLSPCKASSETPAKCRVGIVGYGKIGQFLVKNMDKRLMKLSFVCDPGNPGQI